MDSLFDELLGLHNTNAEESLLLAASDAAALLDISETELEHLRMRGEIRAEGHRDFPWQSYIWRYRHAEVRDYFERNLVSAPGPIEAYANQIVAHAIGIGASDVLIVAEKWGACIRIRVDGTLNELARVTCDVGEALVRRFLIMAGVTISVNRPVAHEATFVAGKDDEFRTVRLTSVATHRGQTLTLHFNRAESFASLSDLGLTDPESAARATELVDNIRPGLLIFAAPRGEGLSTTLRTLLPRIVSGDRNIYLFDDSEATSTPGVISVPIARDRGVTVRRVVDMAKRQEATLLVFEGISDAETALAALEASEAGFAVWATVRVADFPSTSEPASAIESVFTRFRAWGISRERVEAVLRGAILQRLARHLCPDCREPIEPNPFERRTMELAGIRPAPDVVYRAGHCCFCRDTGYRGRSGLFLIHPPSFREDGLNSIADFALRRFAEGAIDAHEWWRLNSWR